MKLLPIAATGLLLAGLAAARLPACPVGTLLKAPAKPVVAGRLAFVKLTVKNNATALSSLNIKIVLPSDCCVEKAGASPSLKKTSSPTPKNPVVVDQDAYWLTTRLLPKKSRSFYLKLRVSSRYTASVVLPITASVYVTDTAGTATCVSDVEDATVRENLDGDGRVRPSVWLVKRLQSSASATHTTAARRARQEEAP